MYECDIVYQRNDQEDIKEMESISSLIELQNYLENQIHHSTILDLSKVLKIYLNDIVEKYNRDFGSKWTIDEILQNSICD